MKNLKKLMLYLIAILVFIPIILNMILGADTPNYFNVIGQPVDWLLFYGSYIGGIATAVIGFITIYASNRQNRLKIEITYKQEALKELRNTLADCIGFFNYSQVGTISLYFDDVSKYNDVLEKLHDYHATIMSKANAWYVAYSGDNRDVVQNFQDAYRTCANYLTKSINAVTRDIKDLQTAVEPQHKTEIIHDINEIIIKGEKQFDALIGQLVSCAEEWIKSEEQEIEKLKEQL